MNVCCSLISVSRAWANCLLRIICIAFFILSMPYGSNSPVLSWLMTWKTQAMTRGPWDTKEQTLRLYIRFSAMFFILFSLRPGGSSFLNLTSISCTIRLYSSYSLIAGVCSGTGASAFCCILTSTTLCMCSSSASSLTSAETSQACKSRVSSNA